MRPMQWLHNKLWLLPLAGGCSCEYKGKRLVIQGSFTPEYLADFRARCRPSVAAVFGGEPRLGEPVAAFSASYPLPLCRRMAAGSCQAKDRRCPELPGLLRAAAVSALDKMSDLESEMFLPPLRRFVTTPSGSTILQRPGISSSGRIT